MSTTQATDAHRVVNRCQPANLTPVTLDASTFDSTSREYLRELQAELDQRGFIPAQLSVDLCLTTDCSYTAQLEVDRLREYVQVASFLGATRVTAHFDEVGNERAIRPALAACVERARREGIALELDGPLALDA